MPCNRLPRLIKKIHPKGRRNQERPMWDFWMRETRMGHQVAQLLDCYMMMMMILD
jgi:hypothetical protein